MSFEKSRAKLRIQIKEYVDYHGLDPTDVKNIEIPMNTEDLTKFDKRIKELEEENEGLKDTIKEIIGKVGLPPYVEKIVTDSILKGDKDA